MGPIVCSKCGAPASATDLTGDRCPSCGARLAETGAIQPAQSARPYTASPGGLESDHHNFDTAFDDPRIRLSNHSETLAILALLIPLVGMGLMLVSGDISFQSSLILSGATVLITAILLAIDAYLLGSIDLNGVNRSGAGALFLGIVLLWIIIYPMAYFRRRHFGRPNMGFLAILVALCFIGVPNFRDFIRLGTIGGVPTCDSKDVVQMVNGLIRDSLKGENILAITDHRQVEFDQVMRVRKGQCKVKIPNEELTVNYNVKMLPQFGTFQVEIEPILFTTPPPCNEANVIGLVQQLLGGQVRMAPKNHREVRFDAQQQVRHCSCEVSENGAVQDVRYRVYWIDQKTGRFQVEIEPN